MANTAKVHVYVKPKTGTIEPVGMSGVIRTSATGEIIVAKKKKEQKEYDTQELKGLVMQVVAKNDTEQMQNTNKNDIEVNEIREQIESEDKHIDSIDDSKSFEQIKNQNMTQDTDVTHENESKLDADVLENLQEERTYAQEQISAKLDDFESKMHAIAGETTIILNAHEPNITVVETSAHENKKEQIRIVQDPYILQNEPTRVLEAALFMAGQGLDNASLGKVVGVGSVSQVQKMMEELSSKYMSENSSIEIMQDVDKKWIMRVKSAYAPAVRQFASETEISKGALKTLAYISKNDGITKRNLFKRLGGQIYEDVAELEQKGFVESTEFGRTKRMHLTQKFRQYFEI